MRKRPYQPDDATALTDLLNLIHAHGGGHGGYTSGEVAEMISTVVRDPALDTSMVFTDDGDLVAAALTFSPPEGGHRADLEGGVHPQWRGRGLGRELLAAQLDRIAAIHTATAAAKDWEAHASAMTGDEDAQRLYRRLGMDPVRYWFEMAAATADPVPAPQPDGLRVVAYCDDPAAEALYQAHTEAFRDHWGSQVRPREAWLNLSVRSDAFRPDLSWLAFDGEEIAGYALSYGESDPGRLYVGQVGTRRPWRRRGVAGGLLSQLIAAAGKAGFHTVSLGVDAASQTGAVGVYERVGFSVESQGVTYLRKLPATG